MIRTCLGAFAARVFAAMVGGRAFLLALVFVFTAGTQAIAQTMTAPDITSEGPFLVDEGETAVATLTADDSDTTAGDLIWSKTGGADSGKFSLTSAGVLTFSAAKDYEAPDDADGDGTYEVTVQVSDASDSDSADLVVTLENVVELTALSGPSTVDYEENRAVRVATYSASSEADRDGLSWSLSGADADSFRIDEPVGVLRFDLAVVSPNLFSPLPDDEAPTDTGTDGTYEVTVEVGDGVTSHSLAVEVTITDQDEAGTLTLSTTRPQFGVALTTTLTDPDGVTGTATYRWERSVGRSAWTDIVGATASSYTLTSAETGHFLRVTATYTDGHGGGNTAAARTAEVVTADLLSGLTVSTTDSAANSGHALRPSFDAGILHYSIGCAAAGETMTLTPTAGSGVRLSIDGTQVSSGESRTIDVEADSEVRVTLAGASGAATTYFVRCLSGDLLDMTVTTASGATGVIEDLIMFGVSKFGEQSVAIVDANGAVRFHRKNAEWSGGYFRAAWVASEGGYRYSYNKKGGGQHWQILDQNLEFIDNVGTVAPLTKTDNHDAWILENGNYVLFAYEPADRDLSGLTFGTFSTSQRVLDSAIQIRTPDGTSLFTWNSYDAIPLEDCKPGFPPTQNDYAHINTVQMVDGDIVASLRGCSTVLRIDPDLATGDKVVWRLALTNLSDEQWDALGKGPPPLDIIGDAEGQFCGQHGSSLLPNGDLILFDNGVRCKQDPWLDTQLLARPGGQYSRAVEYALDVDNNEAVFLRDHSLGGTRSRTGAVHGHVEALPNGDWLIGWGRGGTAKPNESVTQVDPDTGEEKFSITLLQADGGSASIRPIPLPPVALAYDPVPLRAEFLDSGTSSFHAQGGPRPTVVIAFNQAVVDFDNDTPSLDVQGATVDSVDPYFVTGESANAYRITLIPDSAASVSISLLAGQNCGDGGICTADGAALAETPAARTIYPAVTVSFGQTTYAAAEADSIQIALTLSSDPERTIEIPLSFTEQGGASSVDYSVISDKVTFNSGEISKSFTFTATQDTDDDDGESVKLGFRSLPPGVTAGITTEATVSIISVNTAPSFSSDTRFEADENQTATGWVVAVDPDSGDGVAYAITGGADASKFDIGETTGVLTFQVPPNYERAADLASTDPVNGAGNNEYIVTVTATGGTGDRAMTAEQTITVTVRNVEEAGTISFSQGGSAIRARLNDPDGGVNGATWQWARSSNRNTGWTNISGATSARYTPSSGDQGMYLQATVSYDDAHSSGKQAQGISTTQIAPPNLRVATLVSGLSIPWDIAFTPDGTMLFTQRAGVLSSRLADGTVQTIGADFGDLFASGETGLMGIVVDPAFVSNRRFYTCQGHTGPEIQVIAWTLNAAYTQATRVADPLVGGLPASSDRHGGCRLRFGPEGYLWIATGDAASGTLPQDLTSLGGKVLRVDASTGAGAPTNPFAPSRVYTYGHRNVQGLALRPGTSQMWSVEHGPSVDDEINLLAAGRNYGWNPVPGYNEEVPMTDLVEFPDAVEAKWSSGSPTLATSGGVFLEGDQWGVWEGRLAVATLADSKLRLFEFTLDGAFVSQVVVAELDGTFGRLRTPMLGPDGALYVTTSNGGGVDRILRIAEADPVPVTLKLTPASIGENGGVSTVTASQNRVSITATTVTVSAMAVNPAVPEDFRLSANKTLTITAGQTSSSGTVTITANNNTADTPGKTVRVSGTATNSAGVTGPSDVTLTIIDDDDPPTVTLELMPTSIDENGGSTAVTARLDRVSSETTTVTVSAPAVSPAVEGDFALSANKTLTITAGQTTSAGTVTITANNNDADTPNKTVRVSGTATNSAGVTGPSDVTLTVIDDDDPPTVTLRLSRTSISENGGSTTVTARLDRTSSETTTVNVSATAVSPAVAEDLTVSVNKTLTILEGQKNSTGTVTITANNNDADTPNKTVRVHGTADNSHGVTDPNDKELTITDDDAAPVMTLEVNPTVIAEAAGNSTVTVRINNGVAFAEDQQIALTFTGTASKGTDYTVGLERLTLIAGQSSTATTVTAVDDALDDEAETVRVTARHRGGVLGAEQTITITDDDASPVILTNSTILVDENETAVATLTASDADRPAEDLTWRITGGADQNRFRLTADGVLTFAAAQDYEVPGDSDGNGDYEVAVEVRDGANPVEAVFTIRLKDVDDTAPVLSSASVNGDTLTLTYGEALDPNSRPAASDFTVAGGNSARTVSNVAVSGRAVTLTLNPAVEHGDTGIRVSYTPGTNPIQDAAGNDALGLSNERVTNNTGDTTAPTVSRVETTSRPERAATYAAGQEIAVTVTFSETVVVTGTPRLSLNVGGVNRAAAYRSRTGAAAVFVYVVADGESDTDGVSIDANSLTLNGGRIRDGANNNALLTHDGLAANAGHKVDGVKPALAANGGAVVNGTTLTLTFGERLDGSSTPQASAFTVTGGDTSRTVTDVALSGSAVLLTVDPAVEHGETGIRVSYTVPTGTGSIQDVLGNDADRLSNVPVTNETPDTTSPTGSKLGITSDPGTDRTYAAGDEIRVTVTFSEPVDVERTPRLMLKVGDRNRPAGYLEGTGTTELVFGYEVADGDEDTDGVSIEANRLTLNGGTIRDGSNNNAVLDHDGLAANSGHKVDGAGPDLAETGGAVVNGTTLTLTYDEALDGGSRPVSGDFTVSGGDRARTVTGVRVNGSGVELTLDVGAEHGEAGILVSYTVPTGMGANPIRDVPGNDAEALSRESVTNETPDTTSPEVSILAISSNPGSDRTYAAGDEIEVTVTFSETVEVEGTPQLRLRVGSRTRTAGYLRGTDTAALVFGYEVADGDEDTDGVSIEANSLTLNGGTIEDEGDNPAELDHEAVAPQAGHKVDGVRPAFVSAAVDGASLTLTYGEALDGGSRSATGDFTVEVDGAGRSVSGVSVSGSVVILTLNPAVEHGETGIRVSYRPGTNPIQDAAGNDALGLSNESVTNTTGAPNTAPQITSPESFDVRENQAMVRRLAAGDTDPGDEVTGWSIVGGADRFQFSIASDTGVLSFRTAPDYEDPRDTDSSDPVSGAGDNEYVVTVEARSGTGARQLEMEQTIAVRVTDEREPPGVPEAPTFSGETADSLQVSWSEPDNTGPPITDYDVQYRERGTGLFIDAQHAGPGIALTLADLKVGTVYEAQVRATNDEGMSEWSESGEGRTVTPLIVQMTTDLPPPVEGTFSLRFSFSETVTGFSANDIETGQDPACMDDQNTPVFCDPLIGGLETIDDRIFTTTVTPVTDGVAHNYTLTITVPANTVTAVVDSKSNEETATLEVRIAPPGVTVPISSIGLSASPGNGQVALRWNAPQNTGGAPIVRYEYRWAESGGEFSDWMRVAPAQRSETVRELTNGTEYVFEVRGVNALGKGSAETAMATPVRNTHTGGGGGGGGGGPRQTVPDTPTNVVAEGTDGAVVLTWEAPEVDGGAPITDYEHRIDGKGQWISIGSTDTTHTVTGLVNDTAYVFQVRAVNRVGRSPASDPAEATPRMPVALDFTHFTNGGLITSDLVLVNAGAAPTQPTLYFYDPEGHLMDPESVVDITGDLMVTADGALTVQTAMAPLGVLTITTHGQGALVSGSVKVVSDGTIGGFLRFHIPGLGVAGVGASPPVQDVLFPARRQAGGIRTAAALHNLGEEAMGVSCSLMSGGIVLEEVAIPLAANGQTSGFIEDTFTATDTSNFAGAVRCTAPGRGRFTAIAVEIDATGGIFTTLPVVEVNRGRATATTLDFAHFANGTWITDLVFVNLEARQSGPALTPFHTAIPPSRPAIYFYDTAGNPIAAELVVDITGDLMVTADGALMVRTEMEPLGVLTISTHGRGELVSGSVKVVSDGPIGGMVRFDHPALGVAGVVASPPVSAAVFPVRRQDGGITTGFAIHNLESSPGLVRCELRQAGVLLDAATIPLEANGQTAWLIDAAFPGTDTSAFVGSVRCATTGEGLFTAVALEMDPGNRIFTTLPVVPVVEAP